MDPVLKPDGTHLLLLCLVDSIQCVFDCNTKFVPCRYHGAEWELQVDYPYQRVDKRLGKNVLVLHAGGRCIDLPVECREYIVQAEIGKSAESTYQPDFCVSTETLSVVFVWSAGH